MPTLGTDNNMKRIPHPLLLLAGATLIASCDLYDGGPCSYIKYPGSALIVSVAADTSRMRTCENAAVILFTFHPTDSSATNSYRFPAWPDTNCAFLVGSGCTPPLNWAISQGLVVGSEHRCARWEIIEGTCTPVIYKFSDIDYSAWGDSCE